MWGNLHIAFVWGEEDKIDAACTLKQLGLIDFKSIGPDGNTLAHDVANLSSHISTPIERPVLPIARRFERLRENGADLNASNAANQLPIEIALAHSDARVMADTVAALVQAGVDVPGLIRAGVALLHDAVRRGDANAMELLLDMPGVEIDTIDHWKRTALQVAAETGDTALLSRLLDRGASVDLADVEGRTALHRAAMTGGLENVTALLNMRGAVDPPDKYDKSPLHLAVESGRTAAVTALLEAGASFEIKLRGYDEHDHQTTMLHVAAKAGHADVVPILLQGGRAALINAEDLHYMLALECAAEAGHAEVIDVLLRKGALRFEEDGGWETPLHRAVAHGHAAAMDVLLRHGSSPVVQDQDGRAALHFAVSNGNPDIVRALLLLGADMNADSYDGSPLQWALDKGEGEVISVLLEYGAGRGLEDHHTALCLAANSGSVVGETQRP